MRSDNRGRASQGRRSVVLGAILAACSPFGVEEAGDGGGPPTSLEGGAPEGGVPSDPLPTSCHALSFDGANAFVDVPDAPELDPKGPSTLEAWILLQKTDVPELHVVSHHDHNGRQGFLLFVYGNANGDLGASTRSYNPEAGTQGFTQVGFGTSSRITPQKWTHIAATHDGGSVVRVFVDGVVEGQNTNARPSVDYSGVLRIGMSAVGTRSFAFGGLIDEVRLSRVVRYTASFAPAARFTADADTIALWHFDEGAGTTARDVAGGHHGAITGATWTPVGCTTR